MLKISNALGFIVLTLILSGCASGYKTYYKPTPGLPPLEIIAARRVAPPPATPIIERAEPGNSLAILDSYTKRGYIMIGESSFNSADSESEDYAVRQAQSVSADLVLILNPNSNLHSR